MVGCQWPDDNLIDTKVDELTAEMRELVLHSQPGSVPEILADEPGFEVYVNHIRTKLAVDANAFISLSPLEIWESYHGIASASGETYVGELNQTIGAIRDSVSDWEGMAAEAFSKHVTAIETFVTFQTQYVNETLQRLAAAYKVAVLIREDYKKLVDQWIHASREFRESDDERQLEVKLKVSAGLVASVVAVVTAPTVVAAGLAGGATAIGAFVEGYTGTVGGASGRDIIDSYQRAFDNLKNNYDQELERLRLSIEDRNAQISSARPALYEPLPAVCDIEGPDFRYENFFHDFTPPGEFERKVEAERKKYVAEMNELRGLGQNSISRVLSGAGVVEAEVGDA